MASHDIGANAIKTTVWCNDQKGVPQGCQDKSENTYSLIIIYFFLFTCFAIFKKKIFIV